MAEGQEVKKAIGSVFKQLKYEHLVAGISGGVLSTLVLHPLDLLKIRFQVNDGRKERPSYRGLVQATKSITSQNGVRGLYQGVVPNVVGAGASWGFYFFFYNALKTYMQGTSTEPLSAGQHMLAAAQSGVLTLTMTNPIWVVKTRLCLQYEGLQGDVSKVQVKKYRGMVDALWKVYHFEGVTGLYKGFIPGLFGVSHGALQFMAYEELKKHYTSYKGLSPTVQLGAMEYITFAAVSKMFAVVTTYPYQVVRSRLQDQHSQYRGVWDTIVKTFRYEGLPGFYKGMVPNLLRVTPACCITFLVYEKLSHYLLPAR
ncbi:solute carrier family 25 member 32-like isoform X2 [Apostichopus japonicus]|uniref:solute carrier family 25 member 32-like isoform X2 n=1 Tax=Stichopus japonicus TaxID=307972 RepID=UPI003AB70C8C